MTCSALHKTNSYVAFCNRWREIQDRLNELNPDDAAKYQERKGFFSIFFVSASVSASIFFHSSFSLDQNEACGAMVHS